jgi:hypothetical protein
MHALRAPAARGAGIAGRRAQQQQQQPRAVPSSLCSSLARALHRRSSRATRAAAAGNGNGSSSAAPANNGAVEVPLHPPAAETARTVMALAREGALATTTTSGGGGGDSDDGPLSTPVAFGVTREGRAYVTLPADSPEARNLERDARCSVLLAPPTLPARRVAAVALRGTAAAAAAASGDDADSDDSAQASPLPPAPAGARHYYLDVSSALYYGELDGTPPSGRVVPGSDLTAAEPCLLRDAAPALVDAWNGERAEDVYRVAAAHLGVPLARMAYAELLWVDRLGVYVRAEVAAADDAAAGAEAATADAEMRLVRVPFQRPVLDERDARSALTMAAQIAWEGERSYTPPVPAVFGADAIAKALEAAAAAN